MRIGARLIDGLIVALAVLGVLAILAMLGLHEVDGGVLMEQVPVLVTALIGFGYFVLHEGSGGSTLGKMVLGLRVVGPEGDDPAIDVAAKRNLWLLLGVIPAVGGVLSLIAVIAIIVTVAQSEDNRGWHDKSAGATVVRCVDGASEQAS